MNTYWTRFVKMSGTGNDFIMINNMNLSLKSGLDMIAVKLCHRQFGIGGDGLILVEPSDKAAFTMRIFNADGSEAEMCGNGSRCAAAFARAEGIAGDEMKISTLAGIIEAKLNSDGAAIKLTEPREMKLDITAGVKGIDYVLQLINTGVPHAVIFTDDVDDVSVNLIGSAIRHHNVFKPAGTNVNFVQIVDEGTIKVRTYERGVEAETLACGTGAAASAILSAGMKGVSRRPVKVIVPGGELKIDFKNENGIFSDVWLMGPVDVTFRGEVRI